MGLGEGDYFSISLLCVNDINLGTTFPALSALLAAWIPLSERSKLGSLVFGGGQVSIFLNLTLYFHSRHVSNVPQNY